MDGKLGGASSASPPMPSSRVSDSQSPSLQATAPGRSVNMRSNQRPCWNGARRRESFTVWQWKVKRIWASKEIQCALGAVLLIGLAGCGDGPGSKPGTDTSGRSPATAPLDYLAAQGQAKKHSEKVASLAQLQQALQHFQTAEDRWPRDLNELVKSGFLAAVPAAPAGQRLVYDPATGAVKFVRVQP